MGRATQRTVRSYEPPALWTSPPPREGIQIDGAFSGRQRSLQKYVLVALAAALLAAYAYSLGSRGVAFAVLLPAFLVALRAYFGFQQLSRRRRLMRSGIVLQGVVERVETSGGGGGRRFLVTFMAPDGVKRRVRLITPALKGAEPEPVREGDHLPLLVDPTAPDTVAAHLGGRPVGVVDVRKATD